MLRELRERLVSGLVNERIESPVFPCLKRVRRDRQELEQILDFQKPTGFYVYTE